MAKEDLEDFDEDPPEVEEVEAEREFEVQDVALRPEQKGKMSPAFANYLGRLKAQCDAAYEVARKARALGLEPSLEVEVPQAEDLAARVENLLAPTYPSVLGVAPKIRELTLKHGNRELVSLLVAKELARDLTARGEPREVALDVAVRTGLAILTEGVLVAPLEGVIGVLIGKNDDGTDFVGVQFAGPIRAAGGTAQALSVLIADVVRRELGIGKYVATGGEVERLKEEVPAYKQAAHLQYLPTPQEIEKIATGCPVMIDGEGTEDVEISGVRDLPRIPTNRLRGGACLVLAEGLILKAPKVQKHVEKLGIDGWEFLALFLNKKKDGDEKQVSPLEAATAPSSKFLDDLVAGRPVFAGPSRKGGFRLRYGRARTAGLASTAIHPATMVLVEDFLAVGTQMKLERPGKGTVATPCDTIEGPLVLLDNGDLIQLTSAAQAKLTRHRVRRILDLGEILIPFGEFAENNKPLVPSPYVPEWWRLEVAPRLGPAMTEPTTAADAVRLSRAHGIPLHPHFTLFWHDIGVPEVARLSELAELQGRMEGSNLVLPQEAQECLIELGCTHSRRPPGELVLDRPEAFLACLGLEPREGAVARVRPIPADAPDALAAVSSAAGFPVRARSPYRIGARMGRPEKAAERKMSPPVHTLFPIGQAGGLQRQVKDAATKGTLEVEIGLRRCGKCGRKGIDNRCADCGAHTAAVADKPVPQKVELKDVLARAQQRVGMAKLPEQIKGVQGLISKTKTPEPLEKGLLRAKHDITVFKDGTIRYDMTDVPLTHFRPREVHTSVARLKELGYTHDCKGQPLERDEQLLELKVHDIVIPLDGLRYLQKTAAFTDELLEKYYGLPAFYRPNKPEDMVGHLVVGLAPHTSGGVLGRVVGWTKTQAGLAHPYWHAAKRRNCDGDEDCIMLLLDGLLNFSRSYLPQNRGGLMDAPLVLTTRIDPSEIDKEAHNVDVGWTYPLAFYEASQRCAQPKELEKVMDSVGRRLGTEAQYEGLGFTHDTTDISDGPVQSSYKTLGTMMEKMEGQLRLAERIRAVDAQDVATRVIESHFLRDLQGNLKKFSKQKVRCVKCNAKYRRMPLRGGCLRKDRSGAYCPGKITMTVAPKSVTKYLEVSKQVAEKYGVRPYTKQRLVLLEEHVASLFQSDKVTKSKLSDFF
ncbi:MAG: DNA polymerase II large subunit [Halobacteriales archaeon]|nr:DNA polymerase II large subunit [Halobacteriales archaeon]